jgi:hypothetical protein
MTVIGHLWFIHVSYSFDNSDRELRNIGPLDSVHDVSPWITRFWVPMDELNKSLRDRGHREICVSLEDREYPLGLPSGSTRPWTPGDTVKWIEAKYLEHHPSLAAQMAA